MSTRVDPDEIQITRSEKTLAVVLAVFMLIGGLWMIYSPLDRTSGSGDFVEVDRTPAEASALAEREAAQRVLSRARRATEQARRNLELRREAYRTELDAGRAAGATEAAFRSSERRFAGAERTERVAGRTLAARRPAASRAQESLGRRQFAAERRADSRASARKRDTFLLRLGWALASLALAFGLHAQLRQRRSRYLTVGLAALGAATVQAAILAVDYSTDYIEVGEVGPAVLSVVGIVLSLTAMVALQRYLTARLPARRVKRRECPVCAYPVVPGNPHCEGCGREVVAECATCGADRRVGTRRCGACGAA